MHSPTHLHFVFRLLRASVSSDPPAENRVVIEESSSHSTRFPSTQSTNFSETSLVADAYGSRAYEAYEEEQFQNLLNFSAAGQKVFFG